MTEKDFLNYKTKIVQIIEIFFPQAKVYLFGSRARGDHDASSDFDIAIDAGQSIPLRDHAKIVGMIDVLNIAQKVDVVDFHAIPKEMQENILKEGILWKK